MWPWTPSLFSFQAYREQGGEKERKSHWCPTHGEFTGKMGYTFTGIDGAQGNEACPECRRFMRAYR